MKLRDRVVVGFCLSLVLVTVLFVVDLQNENNRRLSAIGVTNMGVGIDSFGDAGYSVHGRSDRSRAADQAQFAWNAAWSTLLPSRAVAPDPVNVGDASQTRPRNPIILQPYQQPWIHAVEYPPNPYADDRFADLVAKLSDSSVPHRGNVADWAVLRDVIVDDTYNDGTASNEYVVEYLDASQK